MKKKNVMFALISAITAVSMIFNTGSGIFAEEKEPVEIISLRSEYEKHYDNGNGTKTAFIYSVPLHYYENNQWKEIDNSLKKNSEGNYINKNNVFDVTLASSVSAKSINSIDRKQMVSLEYNGYTISWDMLATQTNNNHILTASTVELITKEPPESETFSLGGEKLTNKAKNSVDKLCSSVVYNSIYEDVDVEIDIQPTMVKETIILNDKNNVPEQFAYYIDTDGLEAELKEDNSIEFTNELDEAIFTMPAMYMFDSSSNTPEYNYDIEAAITPIKNGYLLTITPDNEWLQSDERVFPVMIDPSYMVKRNLTTMYIDESSPDAAFVNEYLKFGGNKIAGTRTETYIKLPDNFTSYPKSMEILEAELNLCFQINNGDGTNTTYSMYLIREEPYIITWNQFGMGRILYDHVGNFEIPDNFAGYRALDITNCVYMWHTHGQTGLKYGAPNYGIVLRTSNNHARIQSAFSSRHTAAAPYVRIKYTTDSAYSFNFSYKRTNNHESDNDSLPDIDNLQYRMNCYAYALQVYYDGNLNEGESYNLKPGEFGLSYNPNANSYNDLIESYYSYSAVAENNSQFADSVNLVEYMDFIEDRMEEDAMALGYDISKFHTHNYDTMISLPLTLPDSYNENQGRIIAMVAGSGKYSTNPSTYCADYHYYVRHGNGTCTEEGHGDTCSIWSHKPGNGIAKIDTTNASLCDTTINLGAKYGSYTYSPEIRFYIITKDVYLYNSWHGDGRNSTNNSGTPYRP